MRLTDILRDQHAQLVAMLDDLGRHGIAGADGRERLQRAQQAMLSHFSLEESRIYPALQTNPATTALAERYLGELQQLTPALLAFFDTYREGDADPRAFAHSLEQLMAVLRQRIVREEERLYPAYEAYCEPSV
ncbi:MAG TPA: hemerythrin domain-containing protein [Frateuria sp.]|uniref:hemerythrin domain-containing protein n=1 Tax=Frateuria sp. TaxID=2211372 RepID=UPI002DF21C2D|nr:hemerythrin domain-containing protein [Frateuria sp.]